MMRNIWLMKAYFGLISNGGNEKNKNKITTIDLGIYTQSICTRHCYSPRTLVIQYNLHICSQSLDSTSVLEGRVVKVSHCTRTAILQFVDSACNAVQEHVEFRFRNFHFCQFFCQIAATTGVTGGGNRRISPLNPTSLKPFSHAPTGLSNPGSSERQLAISGKALDHTAIGAGLFFKFVKISGFWLLLI